MSNQKIDRANKEDLLIQIGRTQEKIAQQNREIAKCEQEIKSWPRRKAYLEERKRRCQDKISGHDNYINQLNDDLNNL